MQSFLIVNLFEINPSDNADMSNEKGISPRLKLMVFYEVTAPKFI